MKKIGRGLLACLAVLALLAGCSSRGGEKEINLDDAVKTVFEAAGFSEELVEQTDETILHSYSLLNLDQVEEYRCYVSSSMGTPEEFTVFKAKTPEDVAGICKAVDRRVEDQIQSFEDYRPDEMPKLENAVRIEKGNYIFLAVCPESDAVQEALGKL